MIPLRSVLVPVVLPLVFVQCTGRTPSAPSRAAGEETAAGSVDASNAPPAALFRINPPADADGRVRGLSPFEVKFNNCRTVDEDDGDELKFTYDFEGNGVLVRGRCRAAYTYESKAAKETCVRPVVCTSDRQPDHAQCTTWTVCTRGTGEQSATSGFGTFGGAIAPGPVFIRANSPPGPNCIQGTSHPVYYQTYLVQHPGGPLRIEVTLGTLLDSFLHLYRAPFDPSDTCRNLIGLNDDDGPGNGSLIDGTFPDDTYVVVVMGFDDTDVGTYQVSITH
jgi:hypothetical protein